MTTMLHRWNVPASQPLTMSDRALCGATPIDTPCPADDAPIDCPECTFSALPVDVVAELRATPAVEAPRTVKRWCDCVITYTSTWAGPYKARLEVTGVVLDTPCGWHHDAQTGLRDARMGLGMPA